MFSASVNNQTPDFAAPPVILNVTPAPIPLNDPQQVITAVSTGLQKGFSVSILTEGGTLLTTLSGTTQLTYVPDSSIFTFQTNVFTSAGTYLLRIQNPSGASGGSVPSANFLVTVAGVGEKYYPSGPKA
jgi:hypothetical protein